MAAVGDPLEEGEGAAGGHAVFGGGEDEAGGGFGEVGEGGFAFGVVAAMFEEAGGGEEGVDAGGAFEAGVAGNVLPAAIAGGKEEQEKEQGEGAGRRGCGGGLEGPGGTEGVKVG